jgi:4-hydroxybenzoate polyprenyltransferase
VTALDRPLRLGRVVLMMIRPPVAGVILLFAAVGQAKVGAPDAIHPLFTTVLVVLAGWFVNATVLNDLADESIDRVNLASARGRPLVSGQATRAELLAVGVGAAAVSVLVSLAVGGPLVFVVIGGLVLNAAYSLRPLRLSHRGVVASLVLPAAFVVVPYLVGILGVTPSVTWGDVALLPGLYVAFVGRIILKDFRDAAGDAMFGKWTFLLRHGQVATCLVSAVCWVVGVAAVVVALSQPGVVGVLAVASVLCALHGLLRLSSETDRIAQQVIIGAVAHAGRGLCILVLAHLTMLAEGWSAGPQAAVLCAIGAVFAVAYVTTYSIRFRVTALRPY